MARIIEPKFIILYSIDLLFHLFLKHLVRDGKSLKMKRRKPIMHKTQSIMALVIVATLTVALVPSTSLAAGAAPAKAAAKEGKKPIHILFTNVNIFDGFNPK